jgi:hypothetical protein
MRSQPFTWKTEMWIAAGAVALALFALYAVYLHRPV